MTDYENIIRALRKAKLESLESSLERCVAEETEALLARVPAQGGPRRRTSRTVSKATEDAKSYYASELLNELFAIGASSDLTPEQVLNHRRAANIWAIATIMRREGLQSFFRGTK